MNQSDSKLLINFLESPDRPKDTLRYHELQGFLFAISASPETIAPSEWMPMIGNEEPLGFADDREAQAILGLIMALYNETNTAVLERSNSLPDGCAFAEDMSKNFDDAPISQWSRGFAEGHDWLSDVWEKYLVEEISEECGATVMVLSFFGSRQLANAYFDELVTAGSTNKDDSFADFAETMRKMFPDALASYANIGRTIFETVSQHDTGRNEPAVSNKIGRNEPCPCGSGRKYKKCCGNRLH